MSAAALAKLLRKRLRVIFDNLKVLGMARCVVEWPVVNKRGELRYHRIQLATDGVFEAIERIENTESDAFVQGDSAENTPFDAFERLKQRGRGLFRMGRADCGI